MTARAQHTPGPWRISALSGTYIESSNGEGVVDGPPTAEGHENCKLIVRAVNAHADLLAACEAGHKALDYMFARSASTDPTFFPSESPAWPAIVALHAAIAKARGGGA